MNIEQTSYSSFSKEFVLLAVNKPRGIICTHNDEKNRKRIYDLIPKTFIRNIKGNLHSIGRLDFNSQGLILLTNNTKIKSLSRKAFVKNNKNIQSKSSRIINR